MEEPQSLDPSSAMEDDSAVLPVDADEVLETTATSDVSVSNSDPPPTTSDEAAATAAPPATTPLPPQLIQRILATRIETTLRYMGEEHTASSTSLQSNAPLSAIVRTRKPQQQQQHKKTNNSAAQQTTRQAEPTTNEEDSLPHLSSVGTIAMPLVSPPVLPASATAVLSHQGLASPNPLNALPSFLDLLLHPQTHPALQSIKSISAIRAVESAQSADAAKVYAHSARAWYLSSRTMESLTSEEVMALRSVVFAHPDIQIRLLLYWVLARPKRREDGLLTYLGYKALYVRLSKRLMGRKYRAADAVKNCEIDWHRDVGAQYPGASLEFAFTQALPLQAFMQSLFETIDLFVSAPAVMSVPLGQNAVRVPVPNYEAYLYALDKIFVEITERSGGEQPHEDEAHNHHSTMEQPTRHRYRYRDMHEISTADFNSHDPAASAQSYRTYTMSAIYSLLQHPDSDFQMQLKLGPEAFAKAKSENNNNNNSKETEKRHHPHSDSNGHVHQPLPSAGTTGHLHDSQHHHHHHGKQQQQQQSQQQETEMAWTETKPEFRSAYSLIFGPTPETSPRHLGEPSAAAAASGTSTATQPISSNGTTSAFSKKGSNGLHPSSVRAITRTHSTTTTTNSNNNDHEVGAWKSSAYDEAGAEQNDADLPATVTIINSPVISPITSPIFSVSTISPDTPTSSYKPIITVDSPSASSSSLVANSSSSSNPNASPGVKRRIAKPVILVGDSSSSSLSPTKKSFISPKPSSRSPLAPRSGATSPDKLTTGNAEATALEDAEEPMPVDHTNDLLKNLRSLVQIGKQNVDATLSNITQRQGGGSSTAVSTAVSKAPSTAVSENTTPVESRRGSVSGELPIVVGDDEVAAAAGAAASSSGSPIAPEGGSSSTVSPTKSIVDAQTGEVQHEDAVNEKVNQLFEMVATAHTEDRTGTSRVALMVEQARSLHQASNMELEELPQFIKDAVAAPGQLKLTRSGSTSPSKPRSRAASKASSRIVSRRGSFKDASGALAAAVENAHVLTVSSPKPRKLKPSEKQSRVEKTLLSPASATKQSLSLHTETSSTDATIPSSETVNSNPVIVVPTASTSPRSAPRSPSLSTTVKFADESSGSAVAGDVNGENETAALAAAHTASSIASHQAMMTTANERNSWHHNQVINEKAMARELREDIAAERALEIQLKKIRTKEMKLKESSARAKLNNRLSQRAQALREENEQRKQELENLKKQKALEREVENIQRRASVLAPRVVTPLSSASGSKKFDFNAVAVEAAKSAAEALSSTSPKSNTTPIISGEDATAPAASQPPPGPGHKRFATGFEAILSQAVTPKRKSVIQKELEKVTAAAAAAVMSAAAAAQDALEAKEEQQRAKAAPAAAPEVFDPDALTAEPTRAASPTATTTSDLLSFALPDLSRPHDDDKDDLFAHLEKASAPIVTSLAAPEESEQAAEEDEDAVPRLHTRIVTEAQAKEEDTVTRGKRPVADRSRSKFSPAEIESEAFRQVLAQQADEKAQVKKTKKEMKAELERAKSAAYMERITRERNERRNIRSKFTPTTTATDEEQHEITHEADPADVDEQVEEVDAAEEEAAVDAEQDNKSGTSSVKAAEPYVDSDASDNDQEGEKEEIKQGDFATEMLAIIERTKQEQASQQDVTASATNSAAAVPSQKKSNAGLNTAYELQRVPAAADGGDSKQPSEETVVAQDRNEDGDDDLAPGEGIQPQQRSSMTEAQFAQIQEALTKHHEEQQRAEMQQKEEGEEAATDDETHAQEQQQQPEQLHQSSSQQMAVEEFKQEQQQQDQGTRRPRHETSNKAAPSSLASGAIPSVRNNPYPHLKSWFEVERALASATSPTETLNLQRYILALRQGMHGGRGAVPEPSSLVQEIVDTSDVDADEANDGEYEDNNVARMPIRIHPHKYSSKFALPSRRLIDRFKRIEVTDPQLAMQKSSKRLLDKHENKRHDSPSKHKPPKLASVESRDEHKHDSSEANIDETKESSSNDGFSDAALKKLQAFKQAEIEQTTGNNNSTARRAKPHGGATVGHTSELKGPNAASVLQRPGGVTPFAAAGLMPIKTIKPLSVNTPKLKPSQLALLSRSQTVYSHRPSAVSKIPPLSIDSQGVLQADSMLSRGGAHTDRSRGGASADIYAAFGGGGNTGVSKSARSASSGNHHSPTRHRVPHPPLFPISKPLASSLARPVNETVDWARIDSVNPRAYSREGKIHPPRPTAPTNVVTNTSRGGLGAPQHSLLQNDILNYMNAASDAGQANATALPAINDVRTQARDALLERELAIRFTRAQAPSLSHIPSELVFDFGRDKTSRAMLLAKNINLEASARKEAREFGKSVKFEPRNSNLAIPANEPEYLHFEVRQQSMLRALAQGEMKNLDSNGVSMLAAMSKVPAPDAVVAGVVSDPAHHSTNHSSRSTSPNRRKSIPSAVTAGVQLPVEDAAAYFTHVSESQMTSEHSTPHQTTSQDGQLAGWSSSDSPLSGFNVHPLPPPAQPLPPPAIAATTPSTNHQSADVRIPSALKGSRPQSRGDSAVVAPAPSSVSFAE